MKRSNVAGKIPSAGSILLGEMALNTADVILYASGTTENSILPIGWDRVHRTGDTMTGPLIINSDLTVTGTSNLNTVTASTISNVDYLEFNTGYTGNTVVEGRLSWDEDNKTLSLGLNQGDVSLQLGQEQYYLIKNQSGATIENGRVVKAAGTVGASGRILGEYMIADGSVSTEFTLGIATENILNGEDGYVTEFGLVRGIDTTGSLYGETWNDGDILYVSPTIEGGLTNVEPQAPNYHIEMAIVILADANGSIFVRPHRFPHPYDLQDVGYSAGTESNFDILQWDPTKQYFDLTNTPQFNSLSATTISATTFYGDGSNLTGINSDNFYTTGGTWTQLDNTLRLTRNDDVTVPIPNLNTFNGLQSSATTGQLNTGSYTTSNKVAVELMNNALLAVNGNTVYAFQAGVQHSGTDINAVGGQVEAYATTGGIARGLEVLASGGDSNYALKLVDGSQGSGKFLKSIDANGNANWAQITTSDISGLTDNNTFVTGGTADTGGTITLTRNDDVNVVIDNTELKRHVVTDGFDITSGVAYLGTSGAKFLSFDGTGASDETGAYNFAVPSDYISGGTFYIKFTTTATANDVQFEMNITSRNNGDDISTPTDTAIQNATTGAGTSWDMVETAAYNPSSSTFSPNKNVMIKLNRDASDAPDTYTGVAYVWGVVFEYTGIK